MPLLRNTRHEKFAQLVASGMTASAAFTQVGYKAPQNSPRLRNNELVAKRTEELQAGNERKAEMAALTRDDLVKILAEYALVVLTPRATKAFTQSEPPSVREAARRLAGNGGSK
jgi:hypothetical protein